MSEWPRAATVREQYPLGNPHLSQSYVARAATVRERYPLGNPRLSQSYVARAATVRERYPLGNPRLSQSYVARAATVRERFCSLAFATLEYCHRLTLFAHDILNGSRYTLGAPEPACAAVPRPPPSVPFIQAHPIEPTAGVGFEICHHALRRNFGFNYQVHVSRTHVRSDQLPTAMRTHLLYCR